MQCSSHTLTPGCPSQRSLGYKEQNPSPGCPDEGGPVSQDCQDHGHPLPPLLLASVCLSVCLPTGPLRSPLSRPVSPSTRLLGSAPCDFTLHRAPPLVQARTEPRLKIINCREGGHCPASQYRVAAPTWNADLSPPHTHSAIPPSAYFSFTGTTRTPEQLPVFCLERALSRA